MRINSTNLKQFEGGAVVKQGDSASLFGYELLDEQMRPISDLNGKNATIRIFNQKGKATFESTVDNSKVTFKISKPLPIGNHTFSRRIYKRGSSFACKKRCQD